MTHTEAMYSGILATTLLVTAAGLFILLMPSIRKVLTIKLALGAFLLFPLVQLGVVILIMQFDAGGFKELVSGNSSCSSLHGGGMQTGCLFYELFFEGMVVSFVFTLVTFGFFPLAIFTSLFTCFALIKRGFAKPRTETD